MDLKTYLEIKNISASDFATLIGVSAAAIRYYLTGKRKPELRIAGLIQVATMGRVKLEDMIKTWEEKNGKS